MDIRNKRFLVAGTGRSGVAAAELLKRKQIAFRMYDGNENLDKEDFYQKNPNLRDVFLILGTLPEEEMDQTDILVLSPGIPTDLPIVSAMKKKGVLIWGEIELAYVFAKGRLFAITGTNGKTTTTTLLGEIMKSWYRDVKVVGNIGIPYTSVAADTTEETITVAEISSFQLETVHSFAPEIAAILNITPDHLNRHHTMEHYIAAKCSITKNQPAKSLCVLNYEDEELRCFGKAMQPKAIWFSSKRKLENGFYLEGNCIYSARDGNAKLFVKTGELNLLGRHNYENVMAAAAMALHAGVPLEKIREVLLHFTAVEHRIEYVAEKKGILFYNDSKATNPDAAIQGICAMNRPTFLIGGGYDKDASYDDWIKACDGKVKELVLIGQTRGQIAQTAKKHGLNAVVQMDSLEEAVAYCYANAMFGDAVLLSPACASWGMYENYEERGRVFKEIVCSL